MIIPVFEIQIVNPLLESKKVQEEVNSAVSGKEDGVMSVMMLRRMIGCTGLQLGCNGLYWTGLDCTGMY